MAEFLSFKVVFDDGTEVEIHPKSRDMVAAEAEGIDFTEKAGTPMRSMYGVAYAALRRLSRAGGFDADKVPATFQEFLDSVDVEGSEEAPKA